MGIVQGIQIYYTYKRYIHKPGSIKENESHKILEGFEIKTDHPIKRQEDQT